MSEFEKVIISIALLIVLCSGSFYAGYILSDRRATQRINEANNQLAEQQRKYDELIKSTDERIRNIRDELSAKVSSNGETARELSKLVKQIREQRIDI